MRYLRSFVLWFKAGREDRRLWPDLARAKPMWPSHRTGKLGWHLGWASARWSEGRDDPRSGVAS